MVVDKSGFWPVHLHPPPRTGFLPSWEKRGPGAVVDMHKPSPDETRSEHGLASCHSSISPSLNQETEMSRKFSYFNGKLKTLDFYF